MADDGIRTEEQPAEQALAAFAIRGADHSIPPALDQPVPLTAAPAKAPIDADDIELSLFGDLAAVELLWRASEDQASRTFFQSFAWLQAWQVHVGTRTGTSPVIIAGRHPDGTVVFILPLAVEHGRGLRRLTFLGADLCDYNAPLLHPAFSALVDAGAFSVLWPRILAQLRSDPRFGFDVVDLPKMPERVGAQLNPLMGLARQPNPSGAHLTSLGGSWEEFYARKRSAATRRTERKQLRQLGKVGEVHFVDQLEGEERVRTLDVLFEQKAHSFARMGVPNIFRRPGYTELFRSFATDPTCRHLVHLSRLEVGSSIAAASIGFTACSCYYLVLSSYDSGATARLGPGRAHLQELLRFAIRSGIDVFDFTIGDELYKLDWSDGRLTLYDHLSAANLRGAVAVALITGFRTLKRTIKQNAALWRLFSSSRSQLGAFRSGRIRAASHADAVENTTGDLDA